MPLEQAASGLTVFSQDGRVLRPAMLWNDGRARLHRWAADDLPKRRVRAGRAAGQDRRERGLDREHLQARPFLLEHFGAGGDVAAGADAGDQHVDRRVVRQALNVWAAIRQASA